LEPTAIVYPGIAMFFLSFAMVLNLGRSRLAAVRRRDVSLKYYRLYNEGEQPARLQLLSRHVQNHFEVPPLFYVALLFLLATGSVTPVAVVLAWAYFLSRCLHSYIHLGSNDVSRRFLTYGASGLILAGLWVCLLVSLLASGA
jgi:hypothetical protein